jgi:putative copper resistance protein D
LLRTLSRNAALEASLGLGILLIVGYMGVTPPARHAQPDWPFATRWDWSLLETAPKARAEVQRGAVWAGIGAIALIVAVARRRRRTVTAFIALGALGFGVRVMMDAVSTDAYPTTYKRPAVSYQAISVANGKRLYDDAGCAACHGAAGYGDGPLAADLRPKPADLTAVHANTHTAGDLFWWLSHGIKNTSMPGFSQSLSEEESWDLINFMRALSSGDRARALAPVIENEPWLVAPDFTYMPNAGEAKTLRDHRGGRIVLVILLDVKATEQPLRELVGALPALRSGNVEVIVIPDPIDLQNLADRLPGLIVSEGIREISETYKLFARSFSDEGLVAHPRHVEFLIDKQGYIRARWLPEENEGWRKVDVLLRQVELLRNEKPRAPAPDEHVH